MPELPEVEIVRRGLQRWVSGRVVADATVCHPRAVRRHYLGSSDFADRLRGRQLGPAHRRGKFIWLPLEATGEALVAHLGMSGQLLVQPSTAQDEAHLRVRVRFADGDPELRFVDQRTFGGLWVDPVDEVDSMDGAGVPASLRHIALDVLDPDFDDQQFRTELRRRRTGVKRALLDQRLVSGIGNIYADEALWRARLHYARPTETLSRQETERLLAAVRSVMTEALDVGGTSFDALYVDVNGDSGYFDRSLAVYGQAGRACRRCGSTIRRDPFMNRSSFTCPRCQPRPRRARW
jgi:formamidopyrimidine-DNA glycosylase